MSMSVDALPKGPNPITLPDIAALSINAREACLLNTDGEISIISHDQARLLCHKQAVMVCHAPYVNGRLALDRFMPFDVLDLYAFVHPVQFCVPTIPGMAKALGLSRPETLEDEPLALLDIARTLLSDIQRDPYSAKADPLDIAKVMGQQGKGWPWAEFITSALGGEYDPAEPINSRAALNVWKHLPEWAEEAPEPPADHHGITGEESRERLQKLLSHNNDSPGKTEARPAQVDYTTQLTAAFAPLDDEERPHVVLAEAGTGIGKTLGYLAPASVWAEKNDGSVWISTYTKNLQRQIDGELDRLYPDPILKDVHTAIRKGRENYLCLLNLEESAAGAGLSHSRNHVIAAGLMTRWAAATRDGDLTGADFPGWLAGLLGYANTTGLADKRGECVYSACDHYHKCFVERSIRKAKRAKIVVANHALVMINAAIASPGETLPSRYVFDEGHHLFGAADSAFAAHLSARECRDLRRWILGAEGGKRSRARGLERRAGDLTEGDHEAEQFLQAILMAAQALASESWTRRLKDGAPSGPAEAFLFILYKQVYARADGRDGPYSLETPARPALPELLESANTLKDELRKLQKPMLALAKHFRKKLADDDGFLETDMRKRLEAVASGIERRAQLTLEAWISMLDTLNAPETPPGFVDWMEIERIDGRSVDVGLYRHYIDPMKPFSSVIKPHLHGMAVTSATLRDSADEDEQSWGAAITRTGAEFLTPEPVLSHFSSPFDYGKQTKVFIINDVGKNDFDQVAGAYRALFEASGGSALGLFTAIQRLRAVHERIAAPLEDKNIHLYAQHVDDIDAGTLVDIFRDDKHACLLGTDAIRDGVDVPGDSLKLLVFDRVPWPRPTILHKARREAFGKRQYDEMITRLKLKQAFGRLIRRAEDKGVFVMLDSMFPSRLHNAFPQDTEVVKCGLGEAVQGIKSFFIAK